MDGRVTTPQQFLENLEPALSFVAPQEEPSEIPKGLLACCRVQHQVDCKYHVARSLVAASSRRRFEDGAEDEWIHPHPVDIPGDVLAEPTLLFAAVKIHWLLARETARKLKGVVYEMTVAVFTLDTTGSAVYDKALRDYQAEVDASEATAAGALTAEQIRALPIEYLDDGEEEDPSAKLARLIAEQTLVPAEMYADRVEILPNEIGHNGRARYLSGAVAEAPEREAMVWIPDPDPFPKEPTTP